MHDTFSPYFPFRICLEYDELFYKNERYPSADSRNILKILTKMMTIIEKYWQNFAKSCVVTKLFKHGRGSFP